MLAESTQEPVGRWLTFKRLELAAELFRVLGPIQAEHFGIIISDALQRTSWSSPNSELRLSEMPRGTQAAILSAASMEEKADATMRDVASRLERQRAHSLTAWSRGDAEAQAIAYLILFSHVSAQQFAASPRSFLRGWLKELIREYGHDLLQQLTVTFRDPKSSISEKLDALAKASVLGDTAYESKVTSRVTWAARIWRRTETYLMAQVFAWPLLVLGDLGDVSATSLPLGIDLVPNGNGRVILRHVDPRYLSISSWQSMMQAARDHAWMLWRAKHGNYGTHRETIERSDIVVDFQYAINALSILEGSSLQGLELDGSSALPYLVQVFLARFLGHVLPSATVISAVLGKPVLNMHGQIIDYGLRMPEQFAPKLAWARRSEAFSRVVLPAENEHDESVARSIAANLDLAWEEHVELPAAYSLSDLADNTQLKGWRQYRYVRAPDIRCAVHDASGGRKTLLDPDADLDVVELVELLAGSEATVFQTTKTPLAVASALWHINAVRRPAVGGKRCAPSLSWTFVRAGNRAWDDVWELVWNACDGDESWLESFRSARDTESAAVLLANMLNRFDPQVRDEQARAPDIVVLVLPDAGLTDAGTSPTTNSVLEPVAMASMLKQRNLLDGPGDPRLMPLVGRTRLIIIYEAEQSRDDAPLHDLTSDERAILNALQIFQSGFSQITAARFLRSLGYSSEQIRPTLESLASYPGHPLRYGQGDFHVTARWKAPITGPALWIARARLHAAEALCPLLDQTSTPAPGLDKALALESILESFSQVLAAYSTLRITNRDDPQVRSLYEKADTYQVWMLTTLMPHNWSTVHRALTCGHIPAFGALLAAKLIGKNERSTHPMRLSAAARISSAAARAMNGDTTLASIADRHKANADKWFGLAWTGAQTESADSLTTAAVGSNYADYLQDASPDTALQTSVTMRVMSALGESDDPNRGAAVSFRFLARYADDEIDHARSIEMYQEVFSLRPEGIDILVAGLGAALIVNDVNSVEWFVTRIRQMGPDAVSASAYRMRHAYGSRNSGLGPARRRIGHAALSRLRY